jgi:glycosyltransferase involved in cell wall biosynthesis
MGRQGDGGALVLACDFAARHPGNFLPSQFAIARAAHERLGLRTVFVLPERARRRYWVAQIPEAGFRCEFLPAASRARPSALLSIARRAGARIVHAHYTWFDLDALYAGRRTGAAVVWHVRSGLFRPPRLKQRLSDVVKGRVLARGCAAVIAVSDHIASELRERGFPADRILTIPNALVLDRFADPRAARAETRRRLEVPDDRTLVLAFGWPPVEKGADVIAAAAARTTAATTVLVGEQEPLQRFLGGPVDGLRVLGVVDDVASLYGAADIFVSASRQEAFSFAIGEAMACGLAVVGSDIPGTAHYWDAPGFRRYPAGDAGALAQRVAELSDAGLRAQLGAGNRRWAFEHLGIERHVDAVIACYRRLLEP